MSLTRDSPGTRAGQAASFEEFKPATEFRIVANFLNRSPSGHEAACSAYHPLGLLESPHDCLSPRSPGDLTTLYLASAYKNPK